MNSTRDCLNYILSFRKKNTVHCSPMLPLIEPKKSIILWSSSLWHSGLVDGYHFFQRNTVPPSQISIFSVITWKPQYGSSQLWKPLTSHPLGYFSLKYFMHCKTVGVLREIYCTYPREPQTLLTIYISWHLFLFGLFYNVPTFANRECRVVSTTDAHSH
jgi:hypothetical protein